MNCGSLDNLKVSLRWLEPEGLPDPPDRGPRRPALRGHGRPRPVRGIGRCPFQGGHHNGLDLLVGDLPRGARTWLVGQPVQTGHDEPTPPRAHRLRPHPLLGRNLLVRLALSAAQHDPAPQRQRLRRVHPAATTATASRAAPRSGSPRPPAVPSAPRPATYTSSANLRRRTLARPDDRRERRPPVASTPVVDPCRAGGVERGGGGSSVVGLPRASPPRADRVV